MLCFTPYFFYFFFLSNNEDTKVNFWNYFNECFAMNIIRKTYLQKNFSGPSQRKNAQL